MSTPRKTVSNDVIEKLLEVCNQIDSKLQITRDDINVSTFESGAVSDIFRVDFTNGSHCPICIKLYPLDAPAGYEVINSQLNSLLVGQSGIGPKVLLIKPDSLVSNYLENSRELSFQDDHDLSIREQIARKIARFHRIHSPTRRDSVEKYLKTFLEEWIKPNSWFDTFEIGYLRDLAENQKCTNLLEKSLRNEIDEIKNRVLSLHADKIVFSHNDLTHANMLIQDDDGKRVSFIDFDYSCYFFRGADLARYILECTNREFQCANLVSDNEMRQVLTWYVAEASKLDDAPLNASEHESKIVDLLSQTKLMILFNYLLDVIFCLSMCVRKPSRSDQFMSFAEIMFCGYLDAKIRFKIDIEIYNLI